jgi:hypothetical protein
VALEGIISALPHEQSAFVLFTKPLPLEVISTSANSAIIKSVFMRVSPFLLLIIEG